jgi:hypothetical protein
MPESIELLNLSTTPPIEIHATPDSPAKITAQVGTSTTRTPEDPIPKRDKAGELKLGKSATFRVPHTVVGVEESVRIAVVRPSA